jgi:hypothetical protein
VPSLMMWLMAASKDNHNNQMWISASYNTKNTHQKFTQNGIQKRRTTNIRKLLLMLFLWKPKAPKAPKCSLLFFGSAFRSNAAKDSQRETETETETERDLIRDWHKGLASPLDSKPKSSTPAAAACRSAKKQTPNFMHNLMEKKKTPNQIKRPMQLDNHNQACILPSLLGKAFSREKNRQWERALWLQTTWSDGFSPKYL